MTATATQETLLLGPGPSNVPAAVLAALAQPLVGHLDPRFLATMDACKSQLRSLMRTANEVTFPVSGTGSAGMELAMANLIEPGDTVVVGQNGVFGLRLGNLAERYGATVIRVEQRWGRAMTLDQLAPVMREARPKLLAVVNGETSTGVYQPMEGLAELCRACDALLLVDCVTSLGGMPVELDAWGVDAAYSGTQKCLNCPPGLAPVSLSPRAVALFRARTSRVPSFYLDLGEILAYVGGGSGKRAYHHTAPVSMINALHAALGLLLDEGLEARWQRHQSAQERLLAGLADIGLSCPVPAAERLWPLTTISIPDGIDGDAVCAHLMEHHDIELGKGLGPLAGVVWRLGLMGVNADPAVVDRVLAALREALFTQGYGR